LIQTMDQLILLQPLPIPVQLTQLPARSPRMAISPPGLIQTHLAAQLPTPTQQTPATLHPITQHRVRRAVHRRLPPREINPILKLAFSSDERDANRCLRNKITQFTIEP